MENIIIPMKDVIAFITINVALCIASFPIAFIVLLIMHSKEHEYDD